LVCGEDHRHRPQSGEPLRHKAYFLGLNDSYDALRTKLKAEIDADAWARPSETSLPLDKPKGGRIEVKIIGTSGMRR
jgi:adenine-specific DNA-methyltransferase